MKEMLMAEDADRRVAGSFENPEDAEKAAREAREVGARDVRVNDAEGVALGVQGKTQEEVDEGLWGPGAAGTRSQTRGWITGVVLGGALGAGLGVIAGFIVAAVSQASTTMWVLVLGICGAFAGGTVGLTVGGSIGPHVAGEVDPDDSDRPLAAERDATVVVHTDDGQETKRAERAMRAHSPERVDEVPEPPSSGRDSS
jgi:hypothetical protein